MGNLSDTPTKCPLCDEMTQEPVTLKCNHRFCRRCIGDLWSVTSNGPYNCPEWRCKTVYQTLPFDSSLIRPPTQPQPRSSAGTSNNHEQTSFDLRRPSLSSKFLGKRKASTPVSEQPDTKRSTTASVHEWPRDAEIPTTSSSDKHVQATSQKKSKKTQDPEPTVSLCDNGKSSDGKAAPEDDVPQEILIPQNQHNFKAVNSLDDSDSEVDICDGPYIATPREDRQEIGVPASPTKSALPTKKFSKNATSATQGQFGNFSMSDNKNISPVPCHYCPKAGCQPAVKTCLVCGASMCKEHLRPHLEAPVFQDHTLVSPMEDISPWRCKEHQERNQIYCRQCGECVCTVCTVIGSHRDHVCISIREAEQELRGNLKGEIKQLQDTEHQVKNRMTELKEKRETFTVVLREAKEGVQQHYRAVREALEQEEQSALQCVMKEETRVLGGLEEKLSHLQKSLQSIQKGLHTLEGLADARGVKQDQFFIIEYNKTAQLASNMGSCVEQFEAPEEVDLAKLKCLQKWTEKRLDTVITTMPGKERDLFRLLYGTIPFLDADTAHPKLQLSDNNRTVTYSEVQQVYKEHEARFSSFPQVLALSALEGGRWYWEVNVSVDDGRWKVGLCEGQIERKGQKDNSRLGFNSYSWCLACDKKKLEALHNKVSVPVDTGRLQKVGVLLDFEEGVLSFFNVTPEGSLALMHSYKHSFTGPLYPALSVSKTQLTISDLFQL